MHKIRSLVCVPVRCQTKGSKSDMGIDAGWCLVGDVRLWSRAVIHDGVVLSCKVEIQVHKDGLRLVLDRKGGVAG